MTRSEPWFRDFWYVHHLGFLCSLVHLDLTPSWIHELRMRSSKRIFLEAWHMSPRYKTAGTRSLFAHPPTGWTGPCRWCWGIRPTSMALRSNEPRGSLKPKRNSSYFYEKKCHLLFLPCGDTERITQEAFLGTSFATWKGGMDSWICWGLRSPCTTDWQAPNWNVNCSHEGKWAMALASLVLVWSICWPNQKQEFW